MIAPQELPEAQVLMNDIVDILDGGISVSEFELYRLKKEAKRLSTLDVIPQVAFMSLGLIATIQRKPEEVMSSFEAALHISKEAIIYENYFACLKRLNMPIKANDVAENFFLRYSNTIEAIDYLSISSIDVGMASKAVALTKRLIGLFPRNPAYQSRLLVANEMLKINTENNVDESLTKKILAFAIEFLNKKGLFVSGILAEPQHDEFDSWVTYRFMIEQSERLKGLNFEFSRESSKYFINDESAFNGLVISFEPLDVCNT